MASTRIFDQQHYDLLNSSRGEVVSRLLAEIKMPFGLRTAVDVGCGLGHFSGLLQSIGFEITGVDGRQQNVEEAQRRNPNIRFLRFDAEDPSLLSLGRFDLVFCFGLLYHLENPLLAIRHLRAMTEKVLLVEGVIFPGDEPTMGLVDEGPSRTRPQSHCVLSTEACLQKMLTVPDFDSFTALPRRLSTLAITATDAFRRFAPCLPLLTS